MWVITSGWMVDRGCILFTSDYYRPIAWRSGFSKICSQCKPRENTITMKKRYLYSILFGIPGFVVSVVISFVISGFALGILWIYFFGDDPWPASVDTILPILFVLVFLAVWMAAIAMGYVTGKRLEENPILNKRHILISIGLTILPIICMIFYQISIGNIGPKSDGERCGDFCSRQGYSGSSMPSRDSGERTCSCLDDSGLEIIKVPMDRIDTTGPGDRP